MTPDIDPIAIEAQMLGGDLIWAPYTPGRYSHEALLRAADAAYGTYYSYTDPKFTGKERAWRGDPERNPLLRPLLAALAVLDEEGRLTEAGSQEPGS